MIERIRLEFKGDRRRPSQRLRAPTADLRGRDQDRPGRGRRPGGGRAARDAGDQPARRPVRPVGARRRVHGLAAVPLVRTPVGDRYVLEHMRAHGFNIGGEPSGHIILSDYTTTGDGFIAALQVLAVIKRGDKPVSELCHRFEPLPQVLKNVRYQKGKPLENAQVRSAIASAERKLGGGGRLIVRPSGTEPVIRVMGEGDDRTLVESVVDDVVEALSQAAA